MCAWTAPRTWVTSENPSAATMNAHIKDNMSETGPAKPSGTPRLLFATGSNAIAERQPKADYVATSETTTSGTYGDLTTTGPSVSVATGTKAVVWVKARMKHSAAGGFCLMSCAVSGATTIAANTASAIRFESSAADDLAAWSVPITYGLGGNNGALTAGTNVFTAKYARGNTGTATFDLRHLAVIPL